MKRSIPLPTFKRLQWLFRHYVYSQEITPAEEGVDEDDVRWLLVLKSMQQYNLDYRRDECVALHRLFDQPYFLDGNSEGTDIWLAMALAIKEFYALDDEKVQKMLYQTFL